MYAIANVIYGIPITDEIHNAINSEECDQTEDYPPDEEELGFTITYSGSSHRSVGWLGFSLGEFDECCDFPLSDILNLRPTPEQIIEVNKLISQLPANVQAVAKTPDIYVVWSTS